MRSVYMTVIEYVFTKTQLYFQRLKFYCIWLPLQIFKRDYMEMVYDNCLYSASLNLWLAELLLLVCRDPRFFPPELPFYGLKKVSNTIAILSTMVKFTICYQEHNDIHISAWFQPTPINNIWHYFLRIEDKISRWKSYNVISIRIWRFIWANKVIALLNLEDEITETIKMSVKFCC